MRKLLNLFLVVIFLVLVSLFAYKEIRKPEILTVAVSSPEQPEGSSKQCITKDEIHAIIQDYIADNPEMIIKSLESLHKRKVAEQAQKQTNYLEEKRVDIEQADSPPVLGNIDGDITMVAFYDYHCSFCKTASLYESEILAFDPKVKIILRPIPVLGKDSLYAAKVALALQKTSGEHFPKLHNELMKMKRINPESVKNLATQYKIDYSVLENEINSFAIKQSASKNIELAKALGINGTPSYIINGHFVAGVINTEKLKNIILQIRASE